MAVMVKELFSTLHSCTRARYNPNPLDKAGTRATYTLLALQKRIRCSSTYPTGNSCCALSQVPHPQELKCSTERLNFHPQPAPRLWPLMAALVHCSDSHNTAPVGTEEERKVAKTQNNFKSPSILVR